MIFLKISRVFNIGATLLFLLFVSVLFLFETGYDVPAISDAEVTQTVIIDAGHGGEDGGASDASGALEKQINLQISQKLEHILNLCGINTEMTRREDVSLSSGEKSTVRGRKAEDIKLRVKKISDTPNATLISIHQNFFPEKKYKGAQVFFTDNNAYNNDFAKSVQQYLKYGIDEQNNRSEKHSDKSIFLLRNVNCPAILVECGFLSNDEEALLLKKDTHQTKIATSIAAGFLAYQKKSDVTDYEN